MSDKRGLVPFAQGISKLGFTILSTGGTLEALKGAGVPVTPVSQHTASPEILGGRVKTLHPKIHGGILARLDLAQDLRELQENGIQPISLVVVNLYPFRQAIEKGVSEDEAVEQIDIGGPAMVRAAAKNFAHVGVLVDPEDYPSVLAELEAEKKLSQASRKKLMRKAFAHTAAYDASIAAYWCEKAEDPFPSEIAFPFQKAFDLRYGENPHQKGAFYKMYAPPKAASVAFSKVLQGKELSFNNLLDLDAALNLALEFPERPTAIIIKHNTPCGVASHSSLEQAYRQARAIDEISAFGGIVALNRPLDVQTAKALTETFLEAVIVPSLTDEARAVLAGKKNLRLLEAGVGLGEKGRPGAAMEIRTVSGGALYQERDAVEPVSDWKVVSRRAPTDEEWQALKYAWRICKHVKSNAIVFASGDRMLAAGGGQTSRVDSVKIAVARGGNALLGSAVASDAFFPFRDGLDEAAKAGARCVVHPGGSVRDAEIIAAGDEHGMAMVITGVRHFRH